MNTLEEQEHFFTMFEEMWGPHMGEVVLEEPRYSLCEELEKLEKTRIIQALKDAGGNQTKAAQILQIGRTCLIAKMKRFELS